MARSKKIEKNQKLKGDQARLEFLQRIVEDKRSEVVIYEERIKQYSKWPTIAKQAQKNMENAKKGLDKARKDLETQQARVNKLEEVSDF